MDLSQGSRRGVSEQTGAMGRRGKRGSPDNRECKRRGKSVGLITEI